MRWMFIKPCEHKRNQRKEEIFKEKWIKIQNNYQEEEDTEKIKERANKYKGNSK